MRMTTSMLAACVLLSGSTGIALGNFIPDAITNVTAVAGDHGDGLTGNGSPSQVVNGAGISLATSGAYAGSYVHDAYWENGWEASAATTPSGSNDWFMLNLGQTYSNLSKAWIWNDRNVMNRGVCNVDIYYATSPTVVPTMDSAYTFNNSSGWTLLENTNITRTPSSGSPWYVGIVGPADSVLDLSGISNAQYLAFVIHSNYGDGTKTGGGFGGIQITTATATPEPAAVMLLGIGAFSLLAYAWHKRR